MFQFQSLGPTFHCGVIQGMATINGKGTSKITSLQFILKLRLEIEFFCDVWNLHLIQAVSRIDFGLMKKIEKKSRVSGNLVARLPFGETVDTPPEEEV
jgi:hypothetical protein